MAPNRVFNGALVALMAPRRVFDGALVVVVVPPNGLLAAGAVVPAVAPDEVVVGGVMRSKSDGGMVLNDSLVWFVIMILEKKEGKEEGEEGKRE